MKHHRKTAAPPKGLNRNAYEYYSPAYKESVYIYHMDIECREDDYVYEPINVNRTREEFMRKYNISDIDGDMTDKWHRYFFDVMNSSFCRKKKNKRYGYDTFSKLLRTEQGDRAYMICIPRTTQLLYDIIDDNVFFDISRIGRAMLYKTVRHRELYYDRAAKSAAADRNENCIMIPRCIDVDMLVKSLGYNSFDDFVRNEKNNICYALFLKKLYDIILESSQKWCEENNIGCLINVGKRPLYFPFTGIGFSGGEQRKLYFCPFFNTFIFENGYDRFHDRRSYIEEYSDDIWDSDDELIEVPSFASPETILIECGLSAEKKYDKPFMDYYLDDKIYYDHFWNEYGIRNKEEQLSIYGCICRYKRIAYEWLADRGAIMRSVDF